MAGLRETLRHAFAWRLLRALEPELAELVDRRRLTARLDYGIPDRVTIGEGTKVWDALFNTVGGEVRIGRDTFFGHGVMVLTGTHLVDTPAAERFDAVPRSGRDVVIGDNVWLASRVTVIGPCTIGDGAVVAAGAVVTGDVAAHTVVAGVPAKPVRTLAEAP